jgi:hypothetical protein
MSLARYDSLHRSGRRTAPPVSQSERLSITVTEASGPCQSWPRHRDSEQRAVHRRLVWNRLRYVKDPESEESRTGAADAIRALVEAIVLEPNGEHLNIMLKGDLAGRLSAARDSKRSPDTGDLLVQIKLVAGACNQRYLQSWKGAGVTRRMNEREGRLDRIERRETIRGDQLRTVGCVSDSPMIA